MKNIKLRLFIFVIICIVFYYDYFTSCNNFNYIKFKCKTMTKDKPVPVENTTTDSAFFHAVNHIKSFEGFRSKVYLDNDGSPTIGYGHHLRQGENYQNISDSLASIILEQDLQKYLDRVEAKHKVKGDTLLALGLFSYNCGPGALDRAIDNGLLDNPQKILQYCHYKTKDKAGNITVHKSNQLLTRRKYEFALLN